MLKKVIKSHSYQAWSGIFLKNSKNLLAKAGLMIVACAWLLFTAYWFVKSPSWVQYAYPYHLTTFLVVDVAGTVGLGLRTLAGLIAVFTVASLFVGSGFSRLAKLVGAVVVLEALFFLTFLPSAVLGFELGGVFFLVESAIPCLVMSIIIPASLLMLRKNLNPSTTQYSGAIKWACIAGLSYLIVFWVNFLTQWIGTFIQPEHFASTYPGYIITGFIYPGHGISYVLNYPLNLFSFLLTAIGLPLLMVFFLWSVLPTLRDPSKLSMRKVGVTMTLLGGYFIIIILFYVVFGPVGGRSIWIWWFIYNNLDLWCVALPLLGIPLMLGKGQSAMSLSAS